MLLQQLVSDLITKNDNYMEDGMVRASFVSLQQKDDLLPPSDLSVAKHPQLDHISIHFSFLAFDFLS